MRPLLVLLLAACAKPAAPRATPRAAPSPQPTIEEPAAEPVALSEAQQQMHLALSVRDAAPPCAEVEALAEEPLLDWVVLAEQVERPPWVSLRAAGCLTAGHGAEMDDTLLRWVTEQRWMGLGWAVLEQLDALEEAQALVLAEAALTRGPDAERARSRIARSTHPEVAALSGTEPSEP